MTTEESSTHYLQILNGLVNERRAGKQKIDSEYQQVEDKLSTLQAQLESVQREYQQIGGGQLETLKDHRDDLTQEIKEHEAQIKKLSDQFQRISEELKRLNEELEGFKKEKEPVNKEVDKLQRKTKSHRDRMDELKLQIYALTKQRDETRERSQEAQRALLESEKQYLLALQWEKRKPLIFAIGLVLLLVVILFAFVFAANQLSLYGLIPVILITFLAFSVVVIVILRQDDKLKEESFVQLMRDMIKSINLLRKE